MSKGHFSDKDKWKSKAKATDEHNKGRADNYKGQRQGVKQQKKPKEMQLPKETQSDNSDTNIGSLKTGNW